MRTKNLSCTYITSLGQIYCCTRSSCVALCPSGCKDVHQDLVSAQSMSFNNCNIAKFRIFQVSMGNHPFISTTKVTSVSEIVFFIWNYFASMVIVYPDILYIIMWLNKRVLGLPLPSCVLSQVRHGKIFNLKVTAFIRSLYPKFEISKHNFTFHISCPWLGGS